MFWVRLPFKYRTGTTWHFPIKTIDRQRWSWSNVNMQTQTTQVSKQMLSIASQNISQFAAMTGDQYRASL